MKHLTPFLIIIMLIVNQQSIFANDLYSLTVRVVDKDTNRGIEGVEVFIGEARIAKTILTNKDGYCEFPKIFPVGKIVIRTGKKYGYIPRVISATISPRIEDNNIVIELERSNNLIFFGQVRDKKGSYINNATCILKVGSDTEIMSSDSLGFFKHEMAHDRPKSNIAEMEVSAANFKSVSNKQTIQPNQLLYEFNVILKKKINEKKLTRAVGAALGSALVAGGLVKYYACAKPLYNDYKNNPKESDFLLVRSEFNNRQEGYDEAEKRRKAATYCIIGGVLLAGTTYLVTCNKKKKDNRFGFQPEWNTNFAGIKLTYNF